MMLTLTMIRHGKTAGNLRKSYVGAIDQPLAAQGEIELLALRAQLDYPQAERLYCSPMLRCRQTAATLYPGCAPHIVKDMRERDFGEFEGKTHEEIIALPGYSDWGMTAWSMRFPGGEAEQSFYARSSAALWQLAEECDGAGIDAAVLITHGGVIMALMARHGLPQRGYFDWHCKNGCGYTVECDRQRRQLRLSRVVTGSVCTGHEHK